MGRFISNEAQHLSSQYLAVWLKMVPAAPSERRVVFTWPGTTATATPSIRAVELTVGDATLELEPAEVAAIVRQLVS